jgi:26S proteasome regulatory subunit N1
MPTEKEAVAIKVPREDPEKKKGNEDEKENIMDISMDVTDEAEDKKRKDDKDEDELSEEDQLLKETLDTAVLRVKDSEDGVVKLALETLKNEIRTATSSMTSVPKPLKFLRDHYAALEDDFQNIKNEDNKKALADILSVLAMTMAEEGSRQILNYKLKGNSLELGLWGHEFVRSLAGQISEEYNARVTADGSDSDPDVSDIMAMVDVIVPFHIQHNSEPEAVDILLEVQQLDKITDPKLAPVDEKNYQRVCLYLLNCADYMGDPDDLVSLLRCAFQLYKRAGQLNDALRVALRIDGEDYTLISELFSECDDMNVKKQMSLLLARSRTNFEYEGDDEDEINELISNTMLSEQFLGLARELDVMESKTPEDIYKSSLSETNSLRNRRTDSSQPLDSAKQNLASTFVNAFVNAGFGQDSLVTPEGNKWLYKNKEHGMMSATASLGMILQWNVEEGLTQIDKFLYSAEDYIKAGAVLAVGIVSSGVRNECDPALALLSEHVEGTTSAMRSAACSGLGLAYAGSRREDVQEVLTPVVANTDDNADMQEVCLAALSLGLIFVGSCDESVGGTLVQRMMESSEKDLDHTMARYLCLALGLLFLGKQEKADAMVEAVKTVEHKIQKYAVLTLETCAYAGTGNVLKVQQMLHACAEGIGEKKEKAEEGEGKEEDKKEEADVAHQSVAVIGISLVCMGENIGSQMALRTYDHLLQYGEKPIRVAVPLALALMNVSQPDYSIIDIMSRLSHDADVDVAQNAIFGMGLMAGGTNNSRVAGLLRQLADFYAREPNPLFVVRLAQGLLHAGKGLMTFNPFYSDRLLMSPVAVGGILTLLHSCLDMNNTLLGKMHYLMFYLVTAMAPRMLITVDEDMKPLPVSVRVGQAVETVGQAGKPKTISGFQTHTTPVLIGVGDRAELASDEYLPTCNVLEGIVILKKNPDFGKDEEAE